MTALLHLHELTFSRGSNKLFENISLSINPGDRIALVGHNGCGKSSLLALINDTEQADEGEIRKPRGLRLALVEQFVPPTLLDSTLAQALLDVLPAENRLSERYRVDTLLQRLGFAPHHADTALQALSGGEQNLALLGRALLAEPELLLMDEPGNHMDIAALNHLQQFLNSDPVPPFLLFSHDRNLLDCCCNRTLFLRDKTLYAFDLPYESARAALLAQDEQAARKRETEQREIRRIENSANRLARWGRDFDNEDLARKARSMRKKIERLKETQTLTSAGSALEQQLQTDEIRAKSILTLENLQLGTPDGQRHLLSCDFQLIRPGDRIALLGRNGIGKSTTLNALLAASRQPEDSIRFNPKVVPGFYDQKLQQFSTGLGRFDWLRQRCEGPDHRIRQVLLQAGVAYADLDRAVIELSGGERARLMFMQFRLQQPNFLILDEPTNHIDLEGREQLEQQLIESGATLLFTSHDRRFVEHIANRWWWIDKGVLRELHDPEEFYQSLQLHTLAVADPPLQADLPAAQPADSEDMLLQRIESLEKLLKEDRARKVKFQKPTRQQQWQQELDRLWAQLEHNGD